MFPSEFWRSIRSFFHPLRLWPYLSLLLGFSTSSINARASLAFIYFYAFKSISAIICKVFFTSETTNSLDFNPALKADNCTLSTSKVSRMKCFTYDLRVSFSPYLIVSKWSTSLFGRCPPTNWRKKELLSCSKSSIDDVGNFVNHSLVTPLRVVGKSGIISRRGAAEDPKLS